MMPERWKEIDKIFQVAIELPVEEQAAYLIKACPQDTALLAEVKELISYYYRDNIFQIPHLSSNNSIANIDIEQHPFETSRILDNRYLIIKEIGRGGIGIVYLAHDLKNSSLPVAIKVLNTVSSQQEILKGKFEREIKALQAIDHPGIVKLLDHGLLPSQERYFVMEYLNGKNLRELIKPQGMEFEQVVNIIQAIGDILAVVHEQGIYHRDLKPENIFILDDAEQSAVKIIDFGLATVKDSLDEKTKSTSIMGSLSYMAPEQIQGLPSKMSDIYALAVIAYEMVTGQRPFNISNATNQNLAILKLRELQRQGVTVTPKDLCPKLPAETNKIILKALSFKANQRPATAKGFGDSLRDSLRDSLNKAFTNNSQSQIADRRKLIIIRILLVIILIGTILIFIDWTLSKSV